MRVNISLALTSSGFESRNFLTVSELLLANLQRLKYIDHEQPKLKDAPDSASEVPWQAHVFGELKPHFRLVELPYKLE